MDIGHILSTQSTIIENIFIYLNKRELDSCSKVCELWGRVAETEKNRREDIAWFFQGTRCQLHNQIHTARRDCFDEEEENYEFRSVIETDLARQFKDLKIKPNFCLTFASSSLFETFQELFPSFEFSQPASIKRVKYEDVVRKRAFLKAAIQTAVGQHLPEKCKTAFFVAPGVIGCQGNSSPIELENMAGISGIIIPQVPGLKIFNITIDEKNYDVSKFIPKDTNIKCLLVFFTPNDASSYSKTIQSCLLRENSQVAIGGAIVERTDTGHSTAIAFCGRSVEAASVIIKPKETMEGLEERLKRFGQTGLLQDRCFALMFACVAKGSYSYGKYNVESSVFHRLYPDVPLLGVFGNGEIGIDYLPNMSFKQRNEVLQIGKLVRCRKKYLHSYTTIFVLVSIKI